MVHPSHPVWAKDFSTKKSDITTTNIIFKTLIFNFILRLFLSIVDAITNQSYTLHQIYTNHVNLTWQWQFKSITPNSGEVVVRIVRQLNIDDTWIISFVYVSTHFRFATFPPVNV